MIDAKLNLVNTFNVNTSDSRIKTFDQWSLYAGPKVLRRLRPLFDNVADGLNEEGEEEHRTEARPHHTKNN